MNRVKAATVALGLVLPAVAWAGARMAGFEEIAAHSERVEVIGVGWGQSGTFRLGPANAVGRFDRRSSTLRSDDRLGRWGGVRFTLPATASQGELSGGCRYGQLDAEDRSGLTVTTAMAPFGLVCTFARDGEPFASLRLGAVFDRRLRVEERRQGVMSVSGGSYRVRSAHFVEGTRFPASSPIGYVVEHGASPIAAVDLNGGRKRLALPRDPATRDAALATTLALSLLWDPSNDD